MQNREYAGQARITSHDAIWVVCLFCIYAIAITTPADFTNEQSEKRELIREISRCNDRLIE